MSSPVLARPVSAREAGDAALCRLYRNRETVAVLLTDDPAYLPIFERFELEIAIMEAPNPIAKARAVLALQKLID